MQICAVHSARISRNYGLPLSSRAGRKENRLMTMPINTSASAGLNALDAAVRELPHLTLNFYSYGIIMHRRLENGGETEYAVSPEQLATALSAKVRFETGLLSSNTLYLATEGIQKIVVEYRRPQKTALF